MLLTRLNSYVDIKIGASVSAPGEFNTMYVVDSIEMREAADADLSQIQKLYANWGHTFVFLLNDQTFIAESNGRIIGAIRLAFEEATFVLRSLFVHEEFRAQGVAKALLEFVDIELGLAEAYCLALPEKEGLFSGIGFQLVRGLVAPDFIISRKENLRGGNQEVTIMKRTLGLEIRLLSARDLRTVMDLIYEIELPENIKLDENDIRSIYSKIISAGGVVFGAYRGSRMVGTCTLNICANLSWSGRPYGIVENIVVTKSERDEGIAKSLLLFARRMAENKNCSKVSLMTEQRDPETVSFYKSVGFSDERISYQRRLSAEQ
jgi:N-acetylglutamate synthase-like GNAT family acetyltransferase